jgi:hypothetical protein
VKIIKVTQITFSAERVKYYFLQKIIGFAIWANFSQTHLLTLLTHSPFPDTEMAPEFFGMSEKNQVKLF